MSVFCVTCQTCICHNCALWGNLVSVIILSACIVLYLRILLCYIVTQILQ